ncbi:MAG: DUF2062 domain-containing protein [Desulfobacterales bacterium]|jgi:uncharacterized protein (DUF2062 family)
MMNKKSTPSQTVRKENRLLAPLVRTYKRFLKIRGQPREIALGFALGLFVGMTPFIGLHTVMAISLAALLKWNKISAAVAVWFTNAATAPFIYSITYVVGARIAGIKQIFSWKDVESLSAVYRLILHTPEMIWAMVIGGVILGLPLAVAGYYLAFFVVGRYQEKIRIKRKESKKLRSRKKKPRQRSRSVPSTIKEVLSSRKTHPSSDQEPP